MHVADWSLSRRHVVGNPVESRGNKMPFLDEQFFVQRWCRIVDVQYRSDINAFIFILMSSVFCVIGCSRHLHTTGEVKFC